MYKLLIVDDEPLERQALRFFVEHSKLEIDTILEAGNGIDAVQLALTEQPDLCVLDIKMPGLSGLEVMEQIKSVNKHCRVVFSTAYSYFDYAVRALQLGALDFLVKPVKKETLIRVLNKGIDELDAEQSEAEYKTRIKDMTYILEKRILREMISGVVDEETLWFLEQHGIAGDARCVSFYWQLRRGISEEEKESISRQLRRELTHTGYKYQLYAHKQSIDFLLYGRETMQTEKMERVVQDIFSHTLAEYGVPFAVGIGSWVEDVTQLEQSYIEAKGAIDGAQGESCTQEMAAPVRQSALQLAQMAQSQTPAQDAQTVPAEIKKMCAYMQENYAEKIALEDVTQYVGFSKFYGGRLFKQYMGMTIIEYLIDVRLTHAKELLAQGEFSIKQISFMVGYQDPNYFTWSFKKATGISPVKYRYFQNLT
ncbi:MAG: response regulator [Clostridia bacterium]|nr:response regulator [Clostridia bacterium]